MKRLLLAVVLMCAGIASAQTQPVIVKMTNDTQVIVVPKCFFGMQFLVAVVDKDFTNVGEGGGHVVQVMRPTTSNNPPQPMACQEQWQGGK